MQCEFIGLCDSGVSVASRRFAGTPAASDVIAMRHVHRITIEPGKRGGKPCIRGLRVTVQDVLSYLAAGLTQEEILLDFPELEKEDILASLEWAADRERLI